MISMDQAYLPIIAAAISEMVAGHIWYSPYVLGPLLKQVTGNTNSSNMNHKLLMHFAVALIKAAGLFIAISLMQSSKMSQLTLQGFGQAFHMFFQSSEKVDNTLVCSLKTAGFVWAAFMLPSKAACTIWGNQNWKKFGIVVSGQLVMTMAMAATIAVLS